MQEQEEPHSGVGAGVPVQVVVQAPPPQLTTAPLQASASHAIAQEPEPQFSSMSPQASLPPPQVTEHAY